MKSSLGRRVNAIPGRGASLLETRGQLHNWRDKIPTTLTFHPQWIQCWRWVRFDVSTSVGWQPLPYVARRKCLCQKFASHNQGKRRLMDLWRQQDQRILLASIGYTLMPITPALFTTTSIFPSISKICWTTRWTSSSLVTSSASFSIFWYLNPCIVSRLRELA